MTDTATPLPFTLYSGKDHVEKLMSEIAAISSENETVEQPAPTIKR